MNEMGCCMDATGQGEKGKKQFKTPRWVQVWFLLRSRDNWKCKYMRLKAEGRRWQQRVNDVARSREHWRERTLDQQKRVQDLEAENAALRVQAAKKKGGP